MFNKKKHLNKYVIKFGTKDYFWSLTDTINYRLYKSKTSCIIKHNNLSVKLEESMKRSH